MGVSLFHSQGAGVRHALHQLLRSFSLPFLSTPMPMPMLMATRIPVQARAANRPPTAARALQPSNQSGPHSEARSLRPRRASVPIPKQHGALNQRAASRLRVLREFEQGISPACAGRMVISGRMADVCAELDRMASPQMALY